MPQIAPYLAIEAGTNHAELHILDGGGRPQLILELNEDQCRDLSDRLQTIRSRVTLEAPAEAVDTEQLEFFPDLVGEEVVPFTEDEGVETEELLKDVVVEAVQVAEQVAEQVEPVDPLEDKGAFLFYPKPETTDWTSFTKAEIVAEVKSRFDADLDIHDKKDDLIAAAVQLEKGE